jgi:WXG100 family type VII secretion target
VASIRIDYALAVSKAKKIKELSEDVARISQSVQSLREDTESYWQGEAAEVYRNQCEYLENYLRKLDSKMDSLATSIIRIANIIKEADEASARNAAKMTSGK